MKLVAIVSWTPLIVSGAIYGFFSLVMIAHILWTMRYRDRFPAHIIEAVRSLHKAGAFRRGIVSRRPVSRTTDELELTCDHKRQTLLGLEDGEIIDCLECERRWMRAQRRGWVVEYLLTQLRIRRRQEASGCSHRIFT